MMTETGDMVTLMITLMITQEELEQGITDLEFLRDSLLMLKTLTEEDREDMKRTFRTAIESMRILWLILNGYAVKTEGDGE